MSILNIPKKPTVHLDEMQKRPIRPEPYTLKRLLTSDDSKPYMVSFLKKISNMKGPWAEYFQFYIANMNGDIETMKPDIKKYVEKLVLDVQVKYEEMQGE